MKYLPQIWQQNAVFFLYFLKKSFCIFQTFKTFSQEHKKIKFISSILLWSPSASQPLQVTVKHKTCFIEPLCNLRKIKVNITTRGYHRAWVNLFNKIYIKQKLFITMLNVKCYIEVYQTTPKSVRSHFLSLKPSLCCV